MSNTSSYSSESSGLSSQSSSQSSSSRSSSSHSSSSELQARDLPFNIRGIEWKASSQINGSLCAIDYGLSYKNRICQSEKMLLDNYSINRVALYLGSRRGTSTSYNVVVEIYETDADGKPFTLMGAATRPAAEFTVEGWYFFDVNVLNKAKPEQDMVNVVFYQDGGSDLDCIPWFYGEDSSSGLEFKRICYISSNATTWEQVPQISMTMKLINSIDMFNEAFNDTPTHRIKTSPGNPATLKLNTENYLLSGSDVINTKIVSSSDQENEDLTGSPYVTIDHPNTIASIVIDGSGSMGWNDRRNNRLKLAKSISNLLLNTYPGNILVDVIRMGSIRVEGLNFDSSRTYATIKIDLLSPDNIVNNADGSVPSISDGVCYYGLKNLEEGHTYIIAGISSGPIVIEDGKGVIDRLTQTKKPINLSSFGDAVEKAEFSIDTLGPGYEIAGIGEESLVSKLNGNVNQIKRNVQVKRELSNTGISSAVLSGDLMVQVEDSTVFNSLSNVDIFDADTLMPNRTITSIDIDNDIISFENEITSNIGIQASVLGGIVQESVKGNSLNLSNKTTADLLIKDELVSRNVTFYLQTPGGGTLEWSIRPFSEWESVILFYSDVGGKLSLQGFDTDGMPLPDATEIQLFVNGPNSDFGASVKKIKKTSLLNPPLVPGTNTIELLDTIDIKVGDFLTMLGQEDSQRTSGFIVDTVDGDTNTITIFPSYEIDLFPVTDIETEPPVEDGDKGQDPVFLPVSVVDLTPYKLQRAPSPDILLDYDAPPTDHLNADQNSYNQDSDRERKLPTDFPAMYSPDSKSAYVSLQVLPITEDYVDTESEKNDKVASATKKILSDSQRALVESLEEDYRQELENQGQKPPEVTTQPIEDQFTPTLQSKPDDSDYSIETPVLMYGGIANSFMQSFTKEMELLLYSDVKSSVESFDRYGGNSNWKLSGLLGKKYQVYPYVILKNSQGSLMAIKAVDDFDVFFASPYQIWSDVGPTGKYVNYQCVCEAYSKLTGQIERQTSSVDVPGWYASSDETLNIDYVVTEKGNLLKNGNLLIRIFDANRNLEQMADPSSYTPDLKKEICTKCVPAFDVSLQQTPIYSSREPDSFPTYIEAIPLQEATYLDGYSGQIVLPIVNGRCRLSIKAPSKVVAKVIVFAELVFPNNPNKSVVKPDPIWFPSPLSLEYTGQNRYVAGDVSYEIGAKVFYFGQPVADNVTVEFNGSSHKRYLPGQGNVLAAEDPLAIRINEISSSISAVPGAGQYSDRVNEIRDEVIADYGEWPPTPIIPEVSKTKKDSGIARDVFIGPHGEVVNHLLSDGNEKGDEETITIKANYLGFEDSIKTKIEWVGSTEKKDFNFKMRLFDDAGNEYLNGEATTYADGWKSMYVLADLAASVNRFSYVEQFLDALLGKDKNGNKVGVGYPAGILFMGGGGRNVWSENNIRHPLTGDLIGDRETIFGEPGRGYALSSPISKSAFINGSNPKCECVPRGCCEPLCTMINAVTYVNSGDEKYKGTGCAAETQMTCNVPVACENTVIVKEQPVSIRWVEPLHVNIANFGGNDFSILRNGNKTDVVADVTFSGEAIPLVARAHNVTDSSGLPLGMPVVTWDIYKVVKDRDILGQIIRTKIVRDQSVTLTSYSSAVSVELTNAFEGTNGTESHFHKCQIDSQGNGRTTTTFAMGSGEEIPTTHEHQVINYVVQDSTTSDNQLHSHLVKSVASTSINPIFDNTSDICLIAKVSYDASKTPVSRTISFSKCSTADEITNDIWKLQLLTPESYLVQQATTNDYSGFPIVAEITHIVNGDKVEIPDGIRVHFDLEAYLPSNGDSVPGSTRKVAIFAANEDRKFVRLKWKAAISANNDVVNAEAETQVFSPFSWMPNVRGLVPSPTSDSLYIDNALESITTLGASPLHDAAALSASRVIKHRIDNEDWKDCFASSILITDGDENLSDKTLDQGVNAIKRMSENPSAIAAITGQPHPADLFILKRYAEETSGALVNMSGADVDTDVIARKIFSERLAQANTGVYRNVIDLSDVKLIKAATLNVYIPSGCSMLFRTRFSDDQKDWGPWSQNQTVPLSGEIDISSYSDGQPHRYMEYETTLKGNESFESPRFLSLEGSYIEPKKHLLLFAPISVDISSDEYVGEVLITHKVSESSNSTIQYGVLQAETAEENEYYSKAQPLAGTGTRQILLGRHNELATSNDRRTFWLTNGPWPRVAGIEVYKIINGSEELVSPDLYSANPRQGTISFASLQDDDAYLSVSLKYPPLIRIACMITNYGETAISIDHIGLMYNTVQRIERDDSGIIRSPISDIYEMSSSSSESSE